MIGAFTLACVLFWVIGMCYSNFVDGIALTKSERAVREKRERRKREEAERKRIRRLEAMEHEALEPRSVFEWNHSETCQTCALLKIEEIGGTKAWSLESGDF